MGMVNSSTLFHLKWTIPLLNKDKSIILKRGYAMIAVVDLLICGFTSTVNI